MHCLSHREVRSYFNQVKRKAFVVHGLRGRGINTFVNDLSSLGSCAIIGYDISTSELRRNLNPYFIPHTYVFIYDTMGKAQQNMVVNHIESFCIGIPVRFIILSDSEVMDSYTQIKLGR